MLNGADQRSIVRAYQRARTKCTTNTMTTLEGRKQVPMLTKGKFYVVVDPAVRIMGQDNRISVVGWLSN